MLLVVCILTHPTGSSKYKQRVKILSYTTQQKRLVRDLLSNTLNCYVHAGEFRGHLCTPFFRNFAARALRENLTPSNRSSGVQIPRDTCTRFGRYLYSTKCSWIIESLSMTFTADGKRKILILTFYSLLVILKLITQKWTNVLYYSPQIKLVYLTVRVCLFVCLFVCIWQQFYMNHKALINRFSQVCTALVAFVL